MNKAAQRRYAHLAVLDNLKKRGIKTFEKDAGDALELLAGIAYCKPASIAAQWLEGVSEAQIQIFCREWERHMVMSRMLDSFRQ